uniref:AAA family ATPase n=1 Tax=Burkholderia anthina TaxID=179879 RepID=UPI003132C6AA
MNHGGNMRMCIVGPSGTGKTTIAAELAGRFDITVREFDNIYWDRIGATSVKNSDQAMADAAHALADEQAYGKVVYQMNIQWQRCTTGGTVKLSSRKGRRFRMPETTALMSP